MYISKISFYGSNVSGNMKKVLQTNQKAVSNELSKITEKSVNGASNHKELGNEIIPAVIAATEANSKMTDSILEYINSAAFSDDKTEEE